MTSTSEFDESPQADNLGRAGAPTGTLPPPPPTAPQPVRRSGSGWTIFFRILAAGMAATLIAIVGLFAVGVAFVAAIASGDVDIETNRVEIDLTPATIGDLPSSIDEEAADIEIDLTEIDISEFRTADVPVELDVKADFGSITIVVPEDLEVSVDASSDLGDITVFGDSDDGFENTLIRENDDADAILELDLNVGKIEVIRG